jgi:hypothetical protein
LHCTVKRIEQRLTTGHNGVDHEFMTALCENGRHLIADHVVEQGYKRAGSRVNDHVRVRRLTGDLFNQIVKAPRIDTSAFVRTFRSDPVRSSVTLESRLGYY